MTEYFKGAVIELVESINESDFEDETILILKIDFGNMPKSKCEEYIKYTKNAIEKLFEKKYKILVLPKTASFKATTVKRMIENGV